MKDLKLGNKSKQRLTTLVVLGAIVGLGYQVDTAYADTSTANDTEMPATESKTTVADDTTSQKVTLANGSQSGGTTSDEQQTENDATEKPATPAPAPAKDATDPAQSTTEEKEPANPVAPSDPAPAPQTGAPENSKEAASTAPEQTTSKQSGDEESVGTGRLARVQGPQMLLRTDTATEDAAVKAPTIVKSGTFGTSPWTLDSDGVMTFSAGTFGAGISPAFYKSVVTKIVFAGPVVLNANSRMAFLGATNLKTIEGLENVDASQVVDMSQMFRQSGLTSIDLSSWDLSHVTDMSDTFSHDRALTSLKLGKTTSAVTSMDEMLASDSALTSVDAADWNVSSLQDLENLFQGDASLTSLDLSSWDTSHLTSLSNLFSGLSNLTSLNVANWDTSHVTDFVQTFQDLPKLTTLDLSNWDVSSGTQFAEMFRGDSALTGLDLSRWQTGPIVYMGYMFDQNASLTKLDLSGFKLAAGDEGVALDQALAGTTALKELTLSKDMILGDADATTTDNANLPAVAKTDAYTGLWQAVGSGTVANPKGATFTSKQLSTGYDGATMADTYVWQPVAQTTPDNPGTGTDTGNPTNPGNPTTPGTEPDQGTDTTGDGDVVTAGDGDAIVDNGQSTTKRQPKSTQGTADKTSQSAKVVTGHAAATVQKGSNQGTPLKMMTHTTVPKQAQQPVTHQQSQATSAKLPQTNEQPQNWLAVVAGALGLTLLGLNWFKRQN